jgi:hypothetical protein
MRVIARLKQDVLIVFLRRPVIAFFYPALVLFEQLHLPDIFAIFVY